MLCSARIFRIIIDDVIELRISGGQDTVINTWTVAQHLMTTNTSSDMCVCVTVEYASGGSLFDYLSSAESEDISMKQIMTWAMDIAKGVIYSKKERLNALNAQQNTLTVEA